VRIFELVAVQGETDPRLAVIEPFAQALSYYRSREWDKAEVTFNEVLAKLADDYPARLYLKRLDSLRQNPPAGGWDGVFTMTRK
jgi:hypothetical protein